MTITVYISQDTTAVAVGAERVATAFVQAALDAELNYTLVRNGSRGAFGLEPLVCLLYTSPSPRDLSTSRMPSSA